MTAQQVLPVALCLYAPLLAATAFFTRATWRRFLAALVGFRPTWVAPDRAWQLAAVVSLAG